MSPHQIRHQAAVAFRRRCRSIPPKPTVQPLRPAASDETPLSHAEVMHGIKHGLIRSPQFMEAQ